MSICLAMIPFLVTYVPALQQPAALLQETLLFSPEPIDVINVGPSNWLWGRLFASTFVRVAQAFRGRRDGNRLAFSHHTGFPGVRSRVVVVYQAKLTAGREEGMCSYG